MRNSYFLGIIAAILLAGYLLFISTSLLVDEKPHHAQINDFFEGNFELNPDLTTIPGYHYLMFSVTKVFNNSSVELVRAATLLISLLSIIVFFMLTKEITKKYDKIKTLQFMFLPVLFVFFFLIYTDVLSLLFVLLSVYFAINKKYNLSGTFSLLSILVRQTNIIWALFTFLYIYHEEFNFKKDKATLKKLVKRTWTHILTAILFIIFLIINAGVSLGDKDAHPSFQLYTGNIFFMLFLFFFLFLPLNINNFKKIFQLLKSKKTWYYIIGIFLLFLVTFTNTHPYNIQWGEYFIRNRILIFFNSNTLWKIVFFIPVMYSLLSISTTKLLNKSHYLLYPITILFLLPPWLIEQRYYIIPFGLFLLFRKPSSKKVEYGIVVINIIISVILFFMLRSEHYFL